MPTTRRMPGPTRGLAVAWAGAAILAARRRERLGLPAPITTALAFSVPVAVAMAGRRSPRRDMLVWAGQMWAYKVAFELPADDEAALRERTHLDLPLAIDRRIGGGRPPGQRLQRRLRRRGQLTWLDKLVSVFYWTWEAEPHLALAWLRWQRPEAFPAAAARLAATFDLTLPAYWAVPSAPPWWVSEELGRMGGEVRRVMSEVASWLRREPDPTEGDHELGGNPFAAMPSDHFATAAMTAMLLAEQNPRLGAIGAAYAVSLGFSLVYLGEHYVIDLVAGLALALVVQRARRWLEPLAEAVLALDAA